MKILLFILLLCSLWACQSNTLQSIKIGDQEWMTQNLNIDVGEACFCYNDSLKNCDTYGRLYTWEAALDACPDGWRLPTLEDWQILIDHYGGCCDKSSSSGEEALEALVEGGSSQLNISLAGEKHVATNYWYLDNYGYYWTGTEYNYNTAYKFTFDGVSRQVRREMASTKKQQLSCRCIKGEKHKRVEPPKPVHQSVTFGNQTYKTIKLGNQVWMAENLNRVSPKDSSFCFENNPENCTNYGQLYTWEAAMKACPKGWHLPSEEEWRSMGQLFGKEREDHWFEGAVYAALAPSGYSGFDVQFGGYKSVRDQQFRGLDNYGSYWSSSKIDEKEAWYFSFFAPNESFNRNYENINGALSCRCVQDSLQTN
ncbi:MAG: hypothetical protein GY810_05815 [Aureispira sp.]|nr:hypothetical protein [Aureispira sp.]